MARANAVDNDVKYKYCVNALERVEQELTDETHAEGHVPDVVDAANAEELERAGGISVAPQNIARINERHLNVCITTMNA